MVVDHCPGVRLERNTQLTEPLVDGAVVRGRQVGKALDARRERFTRTVQALLLSAVPVRAVPVPLPASSYVAPSIGPSVLRDVSGSWTGLPVPLAGPVTRATSVRMPDVTDGPRLRQRGYPRIHADLRCCG